MGKAKWWVCDGCKSLNDMPANKCYKCRERKSANPTLIDDQYSQVGGEPDRVGVTVDLSQVSDLTKPDPMETETGGAIMDAFDHDDDQPLQMDQASGGPSDPNAGQPTPRPLRDPIPRGISAVGGRDWTKDLPPLPEPEPAALESGAPAPGAPTSAADSPQEQAPMPPAERDPEPPAPERDPEADE